MEDLLSSQQQRMGAMEQLLINFKKDGAERRTSSHIKKRISNLDALYQDFQSNHIKLCEFDDKKHEYFTSNYYNKASEFYKDARAFIMNYLPSEPFLKPATPLASPGILAQQSGSNQNLNAAASFFKEQGTSSKLEEMLRKQKSNFKAFSRTISNIDLDSLSESWEYEELLHSIKSRWSVIDSLHWDIDSEAIEENEEYEETFSNNELRYEDIKRTISSKLRCQKNMEKSTPTTDIPTFSGSYQQWASFKDLFVESIHNNRSMSNGQKMQFLKGKLRGEAERLIQHLKIGPDNYEASWKILNDRYDNKKLILNTYLQNLWNLPILQQRTAASIKKMHDTTNESLNGIKNLGIDVSTWDSIIVFILTQKMDADTHNEYIESLKDSREIPVLQDLIKFLQIKFTNLESSKRKQESVKPNPKDFTKQDIKKPQFYKSFNVHKNSPSTQINKSFTPQKCPICYKEHGIFHCETFLKYQPDMKQQTVAKLSLCKNCLFDHGGRACISTKRCRHCKGEHNTLLHDTFGSKQNVPVTADLLKQHKINTNILQENISEILLATAQIKVQAADGSYHIMRALIDQGSQTSLLSENAAQLLGLPRKQCKGIIFGVGAREQNCKGIVNIRIASIYNDSFTLHTDALIMKHLVNNLPNRSFSKPSWEYIENLQLADPEFYKSSSIDVLLGAEVYSHIIQAGVIKDSECLPVAQQTRFGWILCGSVTSFQCNVVNINVEDIQKFWSIEDVSEDISMSEEDNKCVQLYESTTTRQPDGRYVVRLPMQPDAKEKLGSSRTKAVAQFYQLERKFKKQEHLAKQYKAFIKEYIDLDHMGRTDSNSSPIYFLPHHSVQRAESLTTSLRVVFNASGVTATGVSLNDVMYRGPNLQRDLLELVLKWRQYKYVFTADLEKMFRQIRVHPDDQLYQNIVWRESVDQPLQNYQLKTITYGTKAAPFLAMMTLKRLAKDESHRFPIAAKVLQEEFYSDDLMSGSYSIQTAKQLQSELLALLRSGGFNLRKWASNEPRLLENVSKTQTGQDVYTFRHQESTKALGLLWNSKEDTFTFECKMSQQIPSRLTKRALLSEISKVFDPLGWLAPAVVQLKLLFQNIWLTDLRWDDEVPQTIKTEWTKLRADIENINQIKIPRWIRSSENESIQLHGFCDASIKAYACVVYARINRNEEISVILLAAKTKLVPVSKLGKSNNEVSLPRLELSGAHLLAKLITKIAQSLSSHNLQIYGWCDSTAVLGWLQGDPNRWKPFVSNRVQKITQIMSSSSWHYIKSAENPADCASRGMPIKRLQEHSLWWKGPTWLSSEHHLQQKLQQAIYETDLDIKQTKNTFVTIKCDKSDNNIVESLLSKHSSFTHVSRVLAWILRFTSHNKNKHNYLTIEELDVAKLKLIKLVQHAEFREEILELTNSSKIKAKSKLVNLNPYIDSKGLLRVGGRLKNCNIPEDMKHPLIIPHDGRLTDLLIDLGHKSTFHGGARLTLSWLRQQFWIVGGNRAVKKRLRQCVLCRKHNPSKQFQIMGDLPASRTNQTRPFYHTGVDFTGAVEIKFSKGRGAKTTKGYVAVFVCMVTKAVHIELVSDLTSSAFLAALRRFSARRGSPRHLYSDNGTNFVGANKVLSKENLDLKLIITNEFHTDLSEMKIEWHFNAPSWPSAGGLWEAAVKSLKHHLRRVVGDQKLTFEEFTTLLSQLEACLNSRPLCALSEDPNDLDYLTPSHFLASGPLLTIIETERDARTRWQLAQKIFQDIWKRWRTEYLSQLSSRSKWQQSQDNIKINDIVLIHDANLPAGKWALGRIVDLHPGQDGYVRVVSLKTKNGVIKRPIIKLSVLPVHMEYQNKQIPLTINSNVNENKPKIKKASTNLLTKIFMLIFMLFITTTHGAYNISSIKSYKGLYFDKLSDMRLIQDQWKLVVYYDMKPYWHGVQTFEFYLNRLDTLCKQTSIKSQCLIIMLQLRHDFTELEYYDRMLLHQQFRVPELTTARTRRRRRRGLINGIGYIANSLFGILDDHFAEQYQNDITLIRKNQKVLTAFWKNQTSIVEAENNLLKRIEDSMEKQHKLFNQHLISIDQAIGTLRNEVQNVKTIEQFVLTSIIAKNFLSGLKSIQNTLLDTITNAQQFNVHLISPSQLRDELNIISSQIPKELSLPIDNIVTDLHKIYQIMSVRARMTELYFIFEIQIPLISRESYEMFRLIPIPHQINTAMVSIKPIADYLAINIRKDTYIPIFEQELQGCIHYDHQALFTSSLCRIQKPIYERNSDQNLCVKSQQSNSCATITTSCETTWMELATVNNFILTCCGQCTLRIICGLQVTNEQLTGVNIIALGNECIIKGNTFSITSHRQRTSNMSIMPDVLDVQIAPVNNIINLSLPVTEYLNTTSFQSSLQNISEQIKQLRTSEQEEDDDIGVSIHDVHHYVGIYCVAAAVLAVAGFVWWRTRRPARPARPAPSVHFHTGGSDSDQCVSVKAEQSGKVEPSVYSVQCGSVIANKSVTCAKAISSASAINRASSPIIPKFSFKRFNSK